MTDDDGMTMDDRIERRTGIAPNGKPYESVWDFPRPPRVERVDWRIRVIHRGAVIVDAAHAVRIVETSQPPAYYIAAEFVDFAHMASSGRASRTVCEWKGVAEYADVVNDDGTVAAVDAAWTYPNPTPAFLTIRHHWAFYAQRVEECWVDDERVVPNEGSFYGGWITDNVTGPFKGAPGTQHW